MVNSYGKALKLSISGASRDEKISLRIAGLPEGIKIDEKSISSFLARRNSSESYTTARHEPDVPVFVTGVRNGFTDGSVINVDIYNKDAKDDENRNADIPRPGHADYAAVLKYGKDTDLRGGGRFSGRMTALTCVAGAICLGYLETLGIKIVSHIYSIGKVNDIPFNPAQITENGCRTLDGSAWAKMEEEIRNAQKARDSLGGIIECAVIGVPAGLGEHMFSSCEERISSIMYSVPSVKGVEFGSGFEGARSTGSVNNDQYYTDGNTVRIETNNAGGILGGMTTGMPVVFRVAMKPVPSISKEQNSVSLSEMKNVKISVGGRNDVCVVPRALPIIESAAAIAVTDLILSDGNGVSELDALRAEIDACDSEIAEAFGKRMEISSKIAEYKKKNGLPVYDAERESRLIGKIQNRVQDDIKEDVPVLYSTILSLSRGRQERDLGLDGGNDMSAKFVKKLPIPMEVKMKYPLSAQAAAKKKQNDREISDVFTGKSDKKILVVGPCSADREDAVLEYCRRLSILSEKVSDRLILVARVYTAKPRSDGDGYKGIIHQPDGINSDMFDGIYLARQLDVEIIEKYGLPIADEMLYPDNYRFFSDLISYVAVGARSSENQEHRFVASGIRVPVGMKNPTGGDIGSMLNSVYAAQNPHDFIYRNWEVKTEGNSLAHCVLRGYSKDGVYVPNYGSGTIEQLVAMYGERNLENPGFIVDTNHSNSGKDPYRQPEIVESVLDSINSVRGASELFRGFMIESYLEGGCQVPGENEVFGKSLTDPCLSWDDTEKLILRIAERLGGKS